MMFQGIVASILNRYLGKYIQNLDIQSLNVGIFGGNVELEALRLKPEALVMFTLFDIYFKRFSLVIVMNLYV